MRSVSPPPLLPLLYPSFIPSIQNIQEKSKVTPTTGVPVKTSPIVAAGVAHPLTRTHAHALKTVMTVVLAAVKGLGGGV